MGINFKAAMDNHADALHLRADRTRILAANIANVDLEEAMAKKYGAGCPGCGFTPCNCGTAEKPWTKGGL